MPEPSEFRWTLPEQICAAAIAMGVGLLVHDLFGVSTVAVGALCLVLARAAIWAWSGSARPSDR